MRTFNLKNLTGGSIGLESAEIENAVDEHEEAVLASETAQEAAEIQSDLNLVDSLEQRAIGLEDLAEAIDTNVDQATAGELAITDIAQDLAATGIDGMEIEGTFDESAVPAGEAPALEHFVGTRMSTESIKQRAKDLWVAISALVGRIWDKILEVWRKFFDRSAAITKKAKAVIVKANEKVGATLKEDKNKVELGGLASTFMINGKVCKTKAEINSGVTDLKDVAMSVLETYAAKVAPAGKSIAAAMKVDFTKDTSEEDMKKALKKVNGAALPLTTAIKALTKESVGSDKRFDDKNKSYGRSAHLLQNRMLVSDVADSSKMDDSIDVAVQTAIAIRSARLELKISDEKASASGKNEVDTYTPSEVSSAMENVIALCEVVADFNKKHLRTLEKEQNSLKSAGKSVTDKINDDYKAYATTYANQIASYNTAYANWCSSPFTSVVSTALTVGNAMLALGEKSLACYK